MHTFKPSDDDLPKLKEAARVYEQAKAVAGKAKKDWETAENTINDWLKASRGFEVDKLVKGDAVNIEGAVVITIQGMTRFAESNFKVAHPELHAEFQKQICYPKYTRQNGG